MVFGVHRVAVWIQEKIEEEVALSGGCSAIAGSKQSACSPMAAAFAHRSCARNAWLLSWTTSSCCWHNKKLRPHPYNAIRRPFSPSFLSRSAARPLPSLVKFITVARSHSNYFRRKAHIIVAHPLSPFTPSISAGTDRRPPSSSSPSAAPLRAPSPWPAHSREASVPTLVVLFSL